MINVFQILIINIIYVYQSLHKSREIMTYFETYFDSLCHHTYKHTARKSLQKAIVEKVPIYWLQLPLSSSEIYYSNCPFFWNWGLGLQFEPCEGHPKLTQRSKHRRYPRLSQQPAAQQQCRPKGPEGVFGVLWSEIAGHPCGIHMCHKTQNGVFSRVMS